MEESINTKFVHFRELKYIISKKLNECDDGYINEKLKIKNMRIKNISNNNILFNVNKCLRQKYKKDKDFFYNLLEPKLIDLCNELYDEYDFDNNSDIIFCIFEIHIEGNQLNLFIN